MEISIFKVGFVLLGGISGIITCIYMWIEEKQWRRRESNRCEEVYY